MNYMLLVVVLAVTALLSYHFVYKFLWSTLDLEHGKNGSYVSINGHNLFYKSSNNSLQPLLLIHGIAANLYCWRKLSPLLSDQFCVYEIDLLGFGKSDKPKNNSTYTLSSQADMVLKFIELVIQKPTIIVGSSMGGNIALQASCAGKENIRALVLISPSYDSQNMPFKLQKLAWLSPLVQYFANPLSAKYFIKPLYGKKNKPSLATVQSYLQPFLANTNSFYSLFYSFACLTNKDLIKNISQIKIPSLILWGKNDKLVSEKKYAGELKKLIPHSQLYVHSTAGHHVHEEDAHWVEAQIKTFISGKN